MDGWGLYSSEMRRENNWVTLHLRKDPIIVGKKITRKTKKERKKKEAATCTGQSASFLVSQR